MTPFSTKSRRAAGSRSTGGWREVFMKDRAVELEAAVRSAPPGVFNLEGFAMVSGGRTKTHQEGKDHRRIGQGQEDRVEPPPNDDENRREVLTVRLHCHQCISKNPKGQGRGADDEASNGQKALGLTPQLHQPLGPLEARFILGETRLAKRNAPRVTTPTGPGHRAGPSPPPRATPVSPANIARAGCPAVDVGELGVRV